MNLVVPDAGERVILGAYLAGQVTARPAALKLYTNDYLPGPASVLASFTQATFAGYAPVSLVGATWTPPATVGGRAQSQYGTTPFQWTNTGASAQAVYGYYVVAADGVTVVWAERFNTPIVVAAGGTIQVLPVITAKSEF